MKQKKNQRKNKKKYMVMVRKDVFIDLLVKKRKM